MTIRDYLRRRVTLAYAVGLPAGLMLWASGGGTDPLTKVLFVSGMVAGAAAVLLLNLGLRCPRCKANLAMNAVGAAFTFFTKRRVNYCQFCGVSFDEAVVKKP